MKKKIWLHHVYQYFEEQESVSLVLWNFWFHSYFFVPNFRVYYIFRHLELSVFLRMPCISFIIQFFGLHPVFQLNTIFYTTCHSVPWPHNFFEHNLYTQYLANHSIFSSVNKSFGEHWKNISSSWNRHRNYV